jgi:phytoene desaturase
MRRVVIIGAGLGGLSAAIRLAHAGFSVTILEKNESVGGKMGIRRIGGYSFDTGPSLLTMPFIVRDLFADVGRDVDDYLTIQPINPLCRYSFSDGTTLDAVSDREEMRQNLQSFSPGDVEGFARFLEHGERIYHASAEPFLFSGFGSWDAAGLVRGLKHLPAILKLDAFRTLDEAVIAHVKDPRLRQLLNRFATYNGSSPFLAPATLALIPYIEFTQGGWYLKGGMYSLARALESLADELGVDIRTDSGVRRIVIRDGRAEGVMTESGEFVAADLVIANADAVYTHHHLLAGSDVRKRYTEVEPSLAGFVVLLGVRGTYDHLAHHNIFFSSDYRKEFDAITDRNVSADDPTIYVSVSSHSDASQAPEGKSNLFVLVNAPALEEGKPAVDWSSFGSEYADRIISILESRGLHDLSKRIELKEIITPLDFQKRFNAFRGSIYGPASNSRMAAFLRPPNKSREVSGLFFVGGSSHPGGGIPLVLLSGKIVAGLVEKEGVPHDIHI